MRIRYLVPLVMGLLFVVAFVTAEWRWQGCVQHGQLVCLPFPLYLSYETWQALDIHWPALEIVTWLDKRPDSIKNATSGFTRPQGSRYVITVFWLLGFWYVIGCWWERLAAGHRLAPEQRAMRRAVACGIGILGPLSGLRVYEGIRGGWEGPWMTDAGFITPMLLLGMALVELGVLPRDLTHWTVRLLLASLVVGLHVWAESSYRADLASPNKLSRPRACDTSLNRLCDTDSPTTEDALWLQAPVILASDLVSAVSPVEFSFPGIRYAMVWVYWFMLFGLATGAWPSETTVYRKARPLLKALYSMAFAFACVQWLEPWPLHGLGGELGLMVGMGLAVYALRPRAYPEP